jgi:hypothetical protein
LTVQIRTDQMNRLSDHLLADFVRRATAHLRKHHKARLEAYSDAQVGDYVRTCMARAELRYGLKSEQAVICYCQLPLLLGADFEVPKRFYEVAVILADRSTDENLRAKMALATAYRINASARRPS